VKELKRKFTALFVAAVMMFSQVPFFGGMALVNANPNVPNLIIDYTVRVDAGTEETEIRAIIEGGTILPHREARMPAQTATNNLPFTLSNPVWNTSAAPAGSVRDGVNEFRKIVGPFDESLVGQTFMVTAEANGIMNADVPAPGTIWGPSGIPTEANYSWSGLEFGNLNNGDAFRVVFNFVITVMPRGAGVREVAVSVQRGNNNATSASATAENASAGRLWFPYGATIADTSREIPFDFIRATGDRLIVVPATTASIPGVLGAFANMPVPLTSFTDLTGPISVQGNRLVLHGDNTWASFTDLFIISYNITGVNVYNFAYVHLNLANNLRYYATDLIVVQELGAALTATASTLPVLPIELEVGGGVERLHAVVWRDHGAPAPAGATLADIQLTWSVAPAGIVGIFGGPTTTVASNGSSRSAHMTTGPALNTGPITLAPLAEGNATLTVMTASGLTRLIPIVVGPGISDALPLGWLTGTTTIRVGESALVLATGGLAPYEFDFNWESAPGVATIAHDVATVPEAILIGQSIGTVHVRIRDNSTPDRLMAGNLVVNVIAAELEIDPIDFVLVGAATRAVVRGGEAPFSFVIDDPTIASVATNADGSIATVTALAHGVTTITVTDVNGATAAAEITVPGEFRFLAGDREVRVGETIRLYATGGIAPYAATLSDALTAASLASISVPDSSVPVVVVEGLAEGIVAVRLYDGNEDRAGIIQIRVFEDLIVVPTPTELAVAPVTAPIAVGGTVQLNVTGGTEPYAFAASPDGIVTVGANGLVTGVAAGTAAVIVTDGAGASVEVTVTVTAQQGPIPNAFTRITITTPRTVRLRPNDRIGISVAPLDVVATEEPLFSIQPGGTASAEIGLRNGQITNVTAGGTIIIRVTSANNPALWSEVTFTLLAH
jgi:hypothetical protein